MTVACANARIMPTGPRADTLVRPIGYMQSPHIGTLIAMQESCQENSWHAYCYARIVPRKKLAR